MSKPAHPFAGGRKAKPTKSHRPAIWECMLGTVYASDGTETRYFDYRWDDAREFAGVLLDGSQDLRIATPKQARPYPVRFTGVNGLHFTQKALWVPKS